MLPVQHQEFQSRKWPLVILFVLIGGPFIWLATVGTADKAVVNIFLLSTIIFISFFYFILARLKLVIDNEGLELRMLLKTERVAWSSINKSYITFEFHVHSGDIKWIFNTTKGKSLSFSPTFFSHSTLQVVAETLLYKSPQADISSKVRNMVAGKFPWYIF
jgi:hypothetical protein